MDKLVLDTSAFIQGVLPSKGIQCYAPPSVKEEIKKDLNRIRYENLRRSEVLKEVIPLNSYVSRVEEAARKMGEESLSRTDIEVLALGIQLKDGGEEPTLISDDYSVQNLADMLEIKYKSLATPGIKRRLSWTIYCPGCKRHFEEKPAEGICPVCGTEVKRKPKKGSGS